MEAFLTHRRRHRRRQRLEHAVPHCPTGLSLIIVITTPQVADLLEDFVDCDTHSLTSYQLSELTTGLSVMSAL